MAGAGARPEALDESFSTAERRFNISFERLIEKLINPKVPFSEINTRFATLSEQFAVLSDLFTRLKAAIPPSPKQHDIEFSELFQNQQSYYL